MKKYLALFLLLTVAAAFAACGDKPSTNTAANSNPNDTPTEAYKRLFAAVKAKNTEAIKAEFSRKSIAAIEAQAARMKVPVEEGYRNGFTATTYSDSLPEMRDERVNDTMGALEVWNSKDSKWEDLPFIREESGWKLAVGDLFAGTWKSPGPGRDAKEREAANTATGGNVKIVNSNVNMNVNPNVNIRGMNSNAVANNRR